MSAYRSWLAAILEEGGGSAPFQGLNQIFHSRAELERAGWAQYFEQVYGLGTMRFPFDLGTLHWWKSDWMPRLELLKVHALGQIWGTHTATYGQWYKHDGIGWKNDNRAPVEKGDVWRVYRRHNGVCHQAGGPPWSEDRAADCNPCSAAIRECALSKGVPDHGVIEVTHKCCDGLGEGGGYWMYFAPGSGVFLNVGKTRVIQDRAGPEWSSCGYACLKSRGYDSLQVTSAGLPLRPTETSYLCALHIGPFGMHIRAGDPPVRARRHILRGHLPGCVRPRDAAARRREQWLPG